MHGRRRQKHAKSEWKSTTSNSSYEYFKIAHIAIMASMCKCVHSHCAPRYSFESVFNSTFQLIIRLENTLKHHLSHSSALLFCRIPYHHTSSGIHCSMPWSITHSEHVPTANSRRFDLMPFHFFPQWMRTLIRVLTINKAITNSDTTAELGNLRPSDYFSSVARFV